MNAKPFRSITGSKQAASALHDREPERQARNRHDEKVAEQNRLIQNRAHEHEERTCDRDERNDRVERHVVRKLVTFCARTAAKDDHARKGRGKEDVDAEDRQVRDLIDIRSQHHHADRNRRLKQCRVDRSLK